MGILLCYSTIVVVRGKKLPTSIAYVQRNFYINTTKKRINLFAIGYMINPTLNVNRMFRDQVEKL